MAVIIVNPDVAELQAEQVLMGDLRGYFDLLDSSWNAVANLLASKEDYEPETQAQHVCYHILCRLSSDLRCVYILAKRGYPKQADGLVASVYEVARDIVIIGNCEEYANEWLNHTERKRRFSAAEAYNRFEAGLNKVFGNNVPNSQGAKDFHTNTCMNKHANPITEQTLACDSQTGDVHSTNGPITTHYAEQTIRHALLGASGMAVLAMEIFINYHITKTSQDQYKKCSLDLRRRLEILSERASEIAGELIAQNPFGNDVPET